MVVYFLITLLAIYFHNVKALPDTSQDSTSSTHRTMFGIVWSCLSTIIICAWTSVHPNVPPPNRWQARWNRLKLMFWMIIAPELVLAWAVRQFFAARMIRDAYNERYPDSEKWTLKHGYLLEMGGFILIDRDRKQNRTVLTFDYFKVNSTIDLPEITKADIEDRSKGDALSKIIAILQTTWFIVQCIARGQQHLAITELELVTLALASLNAVTFGIWWHKPLAMNEPVRIYLRMSAPKVESATRQKDEHISVRDIISKAWKDVRRVSFVIVEFFRHPYNEQDGLLSFFVILCFLLPISVTYIITFPFFALFPLGTIFLLRIIKTEPAPRDISQSRGLLAIRIVASLQRFRYWLTSVVSEFIGNKLAEIFADGYDDSSDFFIVFVFGWFILLPLLFLSFSLFIIFLVPFFALLFLVSFIFTAVFGIITTASILPGASHVPSFYAPNTQSDRWSRMVVFALFGVIFGGLHCIGWNFKFPTHLEQVLWRSTSLAISGIPLIVAPIDFLLATRLRTRDIKSCGIFEQVTLLTLDLVMTILLFIYVPARLSLIAQAIALLRSQPTSALTAVDWTKYLPHVFSS